MIRLHVQCESAQHAHLRSGWVPESDVLEGDEALAVPRPLPSTHCNGRLHVHDAEDPLTGPHSVHELRVKPAEDAQIDRDEHRIEDEGGQVADIQVPAHHQIGAVIDHNQNRQAGEETDAASEHAVG